jgi:hypothetical protein
MEAVLRKPGVRQVGELLRGDTPSILAWSQRPGLRQFLLHAAVILVSGGLYGAAMGWWRAPEQALFVAIKFPLIILLTTVGNALLNAMLAPLLGLNMTFRQSLFAILMSFSIASAILGSFSPLTAFLVWNAPPMSPEAVHGATYSLIKLTHVVVIAFAGIVGNARLFQLLVQLGGGRAVARRVLFAWLAGNLFLGSQLSWILRPFIGAPNLPVVFFRDTALQGNVYENVFHTLMNLLQFD